MRVMTGAAPGATSGWVPDALLPEITRPLAVVRMTVRPLRETNAVLAVARNAGS